jgi:hypothetical protein
LPFSRILNSFITNFKWLLYHFSFIANKWHLYQSASSTCFHAKSNNTPTNHHKYSFIMTNVCYIVTLVSQQPVETASNRRACLALKIELFTCMALEKIIFLVWLFFSNLPVWPQNKIPFLP